MMKTDLETEINSFDLTSLEMISNPYPTYDKMLSEHPIYEDHTTGKYHVFKPGYIQTILKENTCFSSDRVKWFGTSLSGDQLNKIDWLINSLSRWLLFQDPPKHMPLRKIIITSLSPKLLNSSRDYIERVSLRLVNEMIEKDQSDLIQGLAYPLPAIVISNLLGFPESDVGKIKQWSDDINAFFSRQADFELIYDTQNSVVEMSQYIKEMLNSNKAKKDSNIIENMRLFQKENKEFTDDDLIANCITLLFAGHETTTYLIANTWYALHQNPEQLHWLRENNDKTQDAVEEGLRFDSPVQRISRVSLQDFTLDEYTIPEKREVFLMLGAANRSSELYEVPNTFDIQRKYKRNLGFGYGPHLCSGASLGRMETTIAINTLLRTFDNGRPIETPTYHHHLGIRMIKRLNIDLTVV